MIFSRLDLKLSLPNPLKSGVKSRMRWATHLLPSKVRLILEIWCGHHRACHWPYSDINHLSCQIYLNNLCSLFLLLPLSLSFYLYVSLSIYIYIYTYIYNQYMYLYLYCVIIWEIYFPFHDAREHAPPSRWSWYRRPPTLHIWQLPWKTIGPCFNTKAIFPGLEIPTLEIRRCYSIIHLSINICIYIRTSS